MKWNKKNGFTLIELIVVIAILAILALLIIPQVTGYVAQSQKVTCDTNRSTLERELLMKSMTDSSNYPVNATGYQKLIKDHGDNVECPEGGTYSWYTTGDNSGYIVCSKHGHGDAIGSNVTTSGTDTGGATDSNGKSVTVKDSSGNTHVITATYSDWNKVSALINSDSGWTIPDATTFTDGTSVYVYASSPNNYGKSKNINSWSDLFSDSNFVKISSTTRIYDNSDIDRQYWVHWAGESYPTKGSLYYYNEKIYAAIQDCGQSDTPINTSGIWFELQ